MGVEVKLRLLLLLSALACAPLLTGGAGVMPQTPVVSSGGTQMLPSQSKPTQENTNINFEQKPDDPPKQVNVSKNRQSLIWSGLQHPANNAQSDLRFKQLHSLQNLSLKQLSNLSIAKDPDAPEMQTAKIVLPKPNFHNNLNTSQLKPLFVEKQVSSPSPVSSNIGVSNPKSQPLESETPAFPSGLVHVQNGELQSQTIVYDARNQQTPNESQESRNYETSSSRDQYFKHGKPSSQNQKNTGPSSQTSEQNLWDKSLNKQELLPQDVPMTTKSQPTRERQLFQTMSLQSSGSAGRQDQSYEAKQTPPRFITVPPLGKDHVVSGKVFFSRSQNGGKSQSLSQNKLQEPSLKQTKPSKNAVLPSGLDSSTVKEGYSQEMTLKPVTVPIKTTVGLPSRLQSSYSVEQLQPNFAALTFSQQNISQTSFNQPQSNFKIHQKEPKEVDFAQFRNQFGQNFLNFLSKLEPQMQPQKSQNYQVFNPQNSEILLSRSQMSYTNPTFYFHSNQLSQSNPSNFFPSSPEESWSLESSNSWENMAQSLPSSQGSTQESRVQPGNANSNFNYRRGTLLSTKQQPSLFNLKPFGSQSNRQFAPIPNPQVPLSDRLSGLQWLGRPGAPPPQRDNMDSEHFGKSQKVVGLNLYSNFHNPHGLYVQKPFQMSNTPYDRQQVLQNLFQNRNPGYRFYQNSPRFVQTPISPSASLQKSPQLGSFSRQNQNSQNQGVFLRLHSPASVHFSGHQTLPLRPKHPWNQNIGAGSISHKHRVYTKPQKYPSSGLRSWDRSQMPLLWDWTRA